MTEEFPTNRPSIAYSLYMKMQNASPGGREDVLDLAEEAFYCDGELTASQYRVVLAIYSDLTGDENILRTQPPPDEDASV